MEGEYPPPPCDHKWVKIKELKRCVEIDCGTPTEQTHVHNLEERTGFGAIIICANCSQERVLWSKK